MYLTEEDLILLVIKALIKKKEAKSDCGCSLKKEMDEIAMEDEMILPLSNRKSRRSLEVSGLVADAPVFTSKTVVSSVLPDSPRNLGVKKSLVLPPSPSRMVSTLPPSRIVSTLPPSPSRMVSTLPPSPSRMTSTLPPSPSRMTSTLPPSPSRMTSTLPPSPSRMTSTLPPRVSNLSSLSYKPGSLPILQKSPVASRTSLPTLSKLTQLN